MTMQIPRTDVLGIVGAPPWLIVIVVLYVLFADGTMALAVHLLLEDPRR